MTRFFSHRYDALTPYVPGEQPKDRTFIKLNTNESPFPPSPKAQAAAAEAAKSLYLYSDIDCTAAVDALSELYGISKDEILFTNGSDEILNFAFMAFCDEDHPAAFADITYGFYPVFAALNRIPYTEIPLKDDLTIDITDYFDLHKTIFIANPNAPTAIALSVAQIEEILKHNQDSIVVIDEAYVDFGGETCVPLIHKYNNLLVTQTFSKSRSMAGARLGFGMACKELINDLNTIKFSTNPYNVNSMTCLAGAEALKDVEYFERTRKTIMETREYTKTELLKLGFEVTDSRTNFLFAKRPGYEGADLLSGLRQRGILVRHFKLERIKDYLRITIGTREQMDALLDAFEDILKETI